MKSTQIPAKSQVPDGPNKPIGEAALDIGSTPTPNDAVVLARECLYRFLSVSLRNPRPERAGLLTDPENQRLALDSAALLREEATTIKLAPGELPPEELDLTRLIEQLNRPEFDLCCEYDRVFGLVTPRECPPYETEYHRTTEAFFRSQQLADVAGFYRAFGVDTAQSSPDRPDHIAIEFEFMSLLLAKQRLAEAACGASADETRVCAEGSEKFFRDHLAWWVPAFTMGLRRKAGTGFFAALSDPVAAFIPIERARLGVEIVSEPAAPVLIEKPEEQSGCAVCPIRLD